MKVYEKRLMGLFELGKRKEWENGENYTVKRFISSTIYEMLLGSNKGG
jgi:hypothetical protein